MSINELDLNYLYLADSNNIYFTIYIVNRCKVTYVVPTK